MTKFELAESTVRLPTSLEVVPLSVVLTGMCRMHGYFTGHLMDYAHFEL